MNKNISYRSSELIRTLIEKDKHFFSLNDATKILKTREPSTVRKLLSDMTKRDLLMRIKGGLYHLIPYEKSSEEYFPNWHLTAEALAFPKKYYIGFYSALEIHNLITQPSFTEQIVTEKQFQSKIQMVNNVKFEFITLSNTKFFGYDKVWIDDFNKVNCSNIEKTIIDCLYKPNYAGGISEIAKAIYKCREQINSEKTIEYLERFNTQSVYKRLGFILQNLNILNELCVEIKSKISNSNTLLDPTLPLNGKHYSRWKILDNVDINLILKSIET